MKQLGFHSRLTHTNKLCQGWWFDCLRSVSRRSPEERLEDQRTVGFHVFVLLNKVKIRLKHRVPLPRVVHKQQGSRIKTDHKLYQPNKKDDGHRDQNEAANSRDQDCSLRRVLRKIDENCIANYAEKRKYLVRLPNGQRWDADQENDEGKPGISVRSAGAPSCVGPEFSRLLKLELLGYGRLKAGKSNVRIANAVVEALNFELHFPKPLVAGVDVPVNFGTLGSNSIKPVNDIRSSGFDESGHQAFEHRNRLIFGWSTAGCEINSFQHLDRSFGRRLTAAHRFHPTPVSQSKHRSSATSHARAAA